jgi:hypothetical protein
LAAWRPAPRPCRGRLTPARKAHSRPATLAHAPAETMTSNRRELSSGRTVRCPPMRRLARHAFTALSALTLLLCMAVCVLRVRSHSWSDRVRWDSAGRTWHAHSQIGYIDLAAFHREPASPRSGIHSAARDASADRDPSVRLNTLTAHHGVEAFHVIRGTATLPGETGDRPVLIVGGAYVVLLAAAGIPPLIHVLLLARRAARHGHVVRAARRARRGVRREFLVDAALADCAGDRRTRPSRHRRDAGPCRSERARGRTTCDGDRRGSVPRRGQCYAGHPSGGEEGRPGPRSAGRRQHAGRA